MNGKKKKVGKFEIFTDPDIQAAIFSRLKDSGVMKGGVNVGDKGYISNPKEAKRLLLSWVAESKE